MNAITDIIKQRMTQDRFATITIHDMPDNLFVVRKVEVHEPIGGLFEIKVDLASDRPNIDFGAIRGKKVTTTFHDRYAEDRHFNGVVVEVDFCGIGDHHGFYRITLRPTLFFLTLVTDCRIFQDVDVADITRTIFAEQNIHDFALLINEPLKKFQFCAQYRESCYTFLSRLWAEWGWTLAFRHSKDGHRLILTDANGSMPTVKETPVLEFNGNPGGDVKGPFVRHFISRHKTTPTDVRMRDHTYTNPLHTLEVQHRLSADEHEPRRLEHYEGFGRYKDPDEVGQRFARHRHDGFRAEVVTGEGWGSCQHLSAGQKFTLADHPVKLLNDQYVITSVHHTFTQPTAVEEDAGEAGGVFMEQHFTCMPSSRQYRPSQIVRPVMDGVHLCLVDGEEGEEIVTDSQGRVQVKFPWDWRGDRSYWIRVSSAWASGNWGQIATPRVGDHVIVSYTDGDPDQPILTGRAYNSLKPTPYELPLHKTKTTFRTQTHKGEGYNEISAEDEAGQEDLFMHAQRDHTIKVRNNHTHRVDANSVQSVGAHQLTEVAGNSSQSTGGGVNTVIGAVGGAAPSLLTGLLSPLFGVSSALLKEAMAITGGSGKSGGSGSGSDSGSSSADSTDSSGSGSSSGGGGLMDQISAYAEKLGGATLGMLPTGALDMARTAINAASAFGLKTSAGTSMSTATSQLSGLLSGLISPGHQNTTVGQAQNTNVGAVQTQQVGHTKVTTVGQVSMEAVGHTKKVIVGEKIIFECGKTLFSMDKDGKVIMSGENFLIQASGPIQINGKVVDIN